MCVCACVYVRACVYVCVCARARACVCMCMGEGWGGVGGKRVKQAQTQIISCIYIKRPPPHPTFAVVVVCFVLRRYVKTRFIFMG